MKAQTLFPELADLNIELRPSSSATPRLPARGSTAAAETLLYSALLSPEDYGNAYPLVRHLATVGTLAGAPVQAANPASADELLAAMESDGAFALFAPQARSEGPASPDADEDAPHTWRDILGTASVHVVEPGARRGPHTLAFVCHGVGRDLEENGASSATPLAHHEYILAFDTRSRTWTRATMFCPGPPWCPEECDQIGTAGQVEHRWSQRKLVWLADEITWEPDPD